MRSSRDGFNGDWHKLMSKWISVEDRFPEEGQRVIYYFERTGIDIGKYWQGKKNYDKGINYFGGNRGFLGGDVTHWMPLPDSPKTGET